MNLNAMILVIKKYAILVRARVFRNYYSYCIYFRIGDIPPLYLKMFQRSDYRNFCLNFVHNSFCLFKKALPL